MPFIFGSYKVSDADALTAALHFDQACLANYDFGGTSAPDTVDTADIGRLIGSRMVGMNAREAAELIRLGPSAPWHDVPIDARLEDAAPASALFGAAAALREHFKSIKGVRDAKVTKLLAMKRPAMFPVIDSRVVTLYKVAAAQKVGVSYPTTAAIREDVLAKATVTALAKLRSALLKNGSPKALRLAQLTGLRLRDVVLWQHWELVDKPPPAPAWPKRVAW
jgi:hypothetical protein